MPSFNDPVVDADDLQEAVRSLAHTQQAPKCTQQRDVVARQQRANQLAQREDFPEPIARLAAGPIWESADIERWARQSGRIA